MEVYLHTFLTQVVDEKHGQFDSQAGKDKYVVLEGETGCFPESV